MLVKRRLTFKPAIEVHIDLDLVLLRLGWENLRMIKRSLLAAAATMFPIGGALSLTLTEGTAWTSFPIPVCFEDPLVDHKQDRRQIRKSVEQSWAKESAVTFKGWRACREGDVGIRIQLSDQLPKTLVRGNQLDGMKGGMELPKLWGLAALSINAKSTVHEFGHALGFGHEYARADAPYKDDCAVIRKNGQRYVENDLPITTFDFDSIMVACVQDATRNFSTGVPKLSAGDIYGLVSVYGSAPANILDADEAGDRFGQSIVVADFDGDDVPDLAVGAPGETLERVNSPEGSNSSSGAVYLYRGDEIMGLRPWGRLVATDHPDAVGLDVVGFGRDLRAAFLNKDQRTDLIVSAAKGPNLAFKGRTRKPPIFLDAETESAKPIKDSPRPQTMPSPDDDSIDLAEAIDSVEPFDIEPQSQSIGFGTASALVDLDVDGHLDLVVTDPLAPSGSVRSGQVFVYRSNNTDFPWKQRQATFVPWYRFGQAY